MEKINLKDIERHVQLRLDLLLDASERIGIMAKHLRSENEINDAGLSVISKTSEYILEECNMLQAICGALTHPNKAMKEDGKRK